MRSSSFLLVIAVVLAIPCVIQYCSSGVGYVEEAPCLFEGFIPDKAAVVILGRPDLARMKQAEEQAKAQKQEFDADPLEFVTAPIQIVKDNTKWTVVMSQTMQGKVALPATQAKVDELLKELAGIHSTPSDIVAEEKSFHGNYNVDDKQALHIIVKGKNGAMMAHLLVGRKPKPGEDADYVAKQGRFVRKAKEPFVIHSGKFNLGLEEDRDSWLDKKVLSFERDQVKRIVVKNKKGGWTVERDAKDDAKWMLTKPVTGEAKASEVAMIINNFSSLHFTHYIGPKTPQLLAKGQLDTQASYVVTVELKEEGVKHTLRIGRNYPEKEGEVFAMTEGQSFVFSMGKHLTEPLRQAGEKLLEKKEEPKSVPPVKKKTPKKSEQQDQGDTKTDKAPREKAPKVKPDGTVIKKPAKEKKPEQPVKKQPK